MRLLILAPVFFLQLAGVAEAQKLPPPSRTVYKCEVAGKVQYSDEPCAGAERIEVEPNRGLTTSGKRAAPTTDVAREIQREQMAYAFRPITGMTPAQFEVARRRVYLSEQAKRECVSLDQSMPALEQREGAAKGAERMDAQARLLKQRQRARELRC